MNELTINQVRNSRTLKILSLGINGTGEMSHGVQSTGTIQDINIEEGNKRKTELSRRTTEVPLIDAESLADRAESDDFLEEVEVVISKRSVWEVGDAC